MLIFISITYLYNNPLINLSYSLFINNLFTNYCNTVIYNYYNIIVA